MTKTINLRAIVQVVHEDELMNYKDEPVVGSKSRLEELYEQDRIKLQKIFVSIDFCPDLIKNPKGEYTIPQQDGEFVEELIRNFTSSNMKCIRDGRYGECEFIFLQNLLTGINNMMVHLDIDENIRKTQLEIMQKKTNFHLLLRFGSLNAAYSRIINNLAYAFTVPGMYFTFKDKCDFFDDLLQQMLILENQTQRDLGKLMKEREEYVKKNSLKLTFEEVQFSSRSKEISRLLNANEEYIQLRSQVEELEKGKGFIYDKEKQKIKLNQKIMKIFHDITEDIPINVEEMTKIEKIMCLCDGRLLIHHEGGTDDWYVMFDDSYDWMDIID